MPFSKLKKQPLDSFLEIIGVVVILGCFLYLTLIYKSLPDSLPRHFGSDGVPDAYGGKGIIWVLPIVGLILYLIVGLISYAPDLINLPFKPSPEKTEFYKMKYSRMLRILNVAMVCIFAFLTFQSAQIGFGNQPQLPQYFSLVAITLLLGIPLIFVIPDLIKARKQN